MKWLFQYAKCVEIVELHVKRCKLHNPRFPCSSRSPNILALKQFQNLHVFDQFGFYRIPSDRQISNLDAFCRGPLPLVVLSGWNTTKLFETAKPYKSPQGTSQEVELLFNKKLISTKLCLLQKYTCFCNKHHLATRTTNIDKL